MANKNKALLFILGSILVSNIHTVNANTINDLKNIYDVKVGSVIQEYDEDGNIIYRTVTDEGTITEDEYETEVWLKENKDLVSFFTLSNPASEEQTVAELQYHLVSLDENGKPKEISVFENLADAEVEFEKLIKTNPDINYCITDGGENYYKIKYGIVNFKSIVSNGYIKTINYKADKTNTSGYLNPAYGFDAAYLETKDGKVKFKIGGVVGWVDESLVNIIPYSDKTCLVSYYKISDGSLIHSIKSKNNESGTGYSGSYNNGYMDSSYGLKEKTAYYSFDGTYFYTNYFDMIDDYREEDHDKALNKNKPYYNYYQYLSHRTKTVYTIEQINKFIAYKTETRPKTVMKNTGVMFLQNEYLYGSNALLTLGVAVNESAWGTSNYAINKNNLFGHAAYDSNPDNATGYASVNESIQYHTQMYVSKRYVSPTIYENGKLVLGSTYFGPNLGDKASGMNIRYASDPFWGEKNSIAAYQINNYFNKEDYGRYTIGMKNVVGALNIRKEPNTNSKVLYKTEEIQNVPFVILDTVTGEVVNGNNKWYKIQSDAPLLENRSSHTTTNDTYRYDYVNSYAYVHSSYVDIVFKGKEKIDYSKDVMPESPKEDKPVTPNPEKPVEPEKPAEVCKHSDVKVVNAKASTCVQKGYTGDKVCNKCGVVVEKGTEIALKPHNYKEGQCSCGAKDPNYVPPFPIGDVNGDYKVSSLDYIKIKNYIMETKTLSGEELKRADVNKDGSITSLDYIKIKNHIMGTNLLF